MKPQKSALLFIFLTVLIDVIGIGLIIPVIPDLLSELTGQKTNEGAAEGGLLIAVFAIFQFLFSPLLGELSDRFGRKPILLIALAGMSIDYLFHAYAPTLGWLFVGRILGGICGASFTVANAYIADISTPENKAKNFGIIGAAFGLGFIIGPGIGGVFGEMDVRLPFLIAAALTFANFLFGAFILPESHPKEKRRPMEWRKIIPGVTIVQLRKFSGIGWLVLAFFLSTLAGQALPSTWNFFTIETFKWSRLEVGLSLMAVGGMVGLVQGLLIQKFTTAFGVKKTIRIGFVLLTVGMFLFSAAVEGWMLYVFLIPYALGGIAGPTLQSVVSNQVSEREQGNLQGALNGLVSITSLLGPIFATTLFELFTTNDSLPYFPGAPYAASGGLLVVATLIAFYGLKRLVLPEVLPPETEFEESLHN